MTTEYEVRLDRGRCDGIFACLVRDERFVEAADGLATIDDAAGGLATDDAADGVASIDDAADGLAMDGDAAGEEPAGSVTATFEDDRLADAEEAAAACPVDAIDVTEIGVPEGDDD